MVLLASLEIRGVSFVSLEKMVVTTSLQLALLSLLFSVCWLECGAQNTVDICDCNLIGSLGNGCDGDGQCACKPGVGGLKCDQCLPDYADLGEEGCRSLDICQCHPNGSLSEDCDVNGVCMCRLGIQGDKCDTCQDGFHRIDLGCIPCPTCFDQVAIQFNATLELYNTLLQRLNETLSTNNTGGGLTPELIAEIARYQILLEDLLQRAINATEREGDLNMDLVEFQTEASALSELIVIFETNVTQAEENIDGLSRQANRTQTLFTELDTLIESLEARVVVDLRMQLMEATMLNRQLQTEFNTLIRLATEANEASLEQDSLANNLLVQATNTLQNATTSLQLLQQAINIQNQTLTIVRMLQNETLPRLNMLYIEGVEALTNAKINVPIALLNATSILQAILNISIPEYDLESRQTVLEQLQNETRRLFNSTTQLDVSLDMIQTNFTRYNQTAQDLISESQALNSEAVTLFVLAEGALSFANDSVIRGNEVIQEARRLLAELQVRLSEARNFTADLEGVIRNIELAEIQSLMAENETLERGQELMEAVLVANRAAVLLEEASVTLRNALEVAMGANSTANIFLSEATALNASATDFAGDVTMAADNVDVLEQAVLDDTEAISMVTGTANETIIAAANLSARLIIVKDFLVNLTAELDAITLIPPERIKNINSTLTSLEQESASNQIAVDSLTDQVRQLQMSADELRARYTQVQQHRDLLSDILRNVEELNCREQFEN